MAPTISAPLRILLLSAPSTPPPDCLHDTSTHEIRTPYYNASIPIWHDTLPTPSTLKAWEEEWKSPEAGEVIQAIGAWILCFRHPLSKDDLQNILTTLTTISSVISHHNPCPPLAPPLLALGMPESTLPFLELPAEEWEDLCREAGGWEWIDCSVPARTDGEKPVLNGFGEKVGVERLREVLETNEWEGGEEGGYEDEDEGEGEEGEGMGMGVEVGELRGEMMGLRGVVGGVGVGEEEGVGGEAGGEVEGEEGEEDGGDEEVRALESMMLKMQAVRNMGADMPEGERRKFAAKAVRDVMKTL